MTNIMSRIGTSASYMTSAIDRINLKKVRDFRYHYTFAMIRWNTTNFVRWDPDRVNYPNTKNRPFIYKITLYVDYIKFSINDREPQVSNNRKK